MKQTSFRKILIANRGEIALRVLRTCRAMGIATVAVYSDTDTHAPHTRLADEAVHLGAPRPQDSYLNIARIIEAAQRTACQAIHPGYGFLSENAAFAEACAAVGLVFIGPSPPVIRQMGSKSAARQLAASIGVPTVLGYDGAEQSAEALHQEMLRIGLPVLIKALAGGGGKGMRVVRDESEIDEALAAARREAVNAFGDGTLLLEKFIEQARHVELQIFGDQYGNAVHLFERDCSLQRRHQKIIEESPSPALTPELRDKMGAAAVQLGQAIGYTNAGTVEFILAPDGQFYFIEVNTRLQVEHPVTEMITGLDLVKLQIEVAEGQPLPFTQAELRARGHAIEARLYAEDPANDFLPATGTLHGWQLPSDVDGLRIDAGVEIGSEIGIYYDPLLAKLIAHGRDRDEALRKLSYGLRRLRVAGVTTNQEFLLRVLASDGFRQGAATTSYIADQLDALLVRETDQLESASAIALALYLQYKWQQADSLTQHLPPGYRNNPYRDPQLKLQIAGSTVELSWRWLSGGQFEFFWAGQTHLVDLLAAENDQVRYALRGIQRTFSVTKAGEQFFIHSALGACEIEKLPRYPEYEVTADAGSANSPMPGQVLKLLVEAGQAVAQGQALLILEAMKMEHTLRAAVAGVVAAILVKPGEVVAPGQVLVTITPHE
jgi:propionyl-CoA carboxylase alpha chain